MNAQWQDEGIVLSARRHGETGAIVSLLTRAQGRCAGYVYGAASAKMRGQIEPGSRVSAQWRARSADELGTFTLESDESPAVHVMADARKLTALQSAMALADKTLPERQVMRGVFDGTAALLAAFALDAWPAVYVRWEIGLLQELGFGLDLSCCAATGATEDLTYVSPKSGRAVSATAGNIYKEKMLVLPAFLRGGGDFDEKDILDGLKLTGHFFRHRVFAALHHDLKRDTAQLATDAIETLLAR